MARCAVAKQTVDLCSAPWTQSIAAEYLASGGLERHLPRIVDAYSVKCRALCDALDTHLARHIAFHRPAGGMFVWARLNAARDASDYLRVCIEQNVMFVPGVAFYKDAADRAALRLSFAAPGAEEIETGVHRMNRALEQYCDEQ
ncbi:DNA-binding transcriptional MocR family regulator [Paraburkholderia sp. RAU6.4a]